MLNVPNVMGWQDVHAFHHTLAMLTQLDVVRNVYSMPIVQVIWLASNNIVAIHAEVFVDGMLNALWSITYQFVRAKEVMKAIHSLAVDSVRLFQPIANNLEFSITKKFFVLFTTEEIEVDTPVNPCEPSPCGPNANCRVQGDRPICSCKIGYLGSPPGCRPECVVSSECDHNLACINQKCRDPCPGSCGG